MEVPFSDLYEKLSTPFPPEETFKDVRGGTELTYITGEQVVTRLNTFIGFMGWDFTVVEHGIHAEADEVWVLGRLTIRIDGETKTMDAFGSQKVKRSRASGTPMDIGFDLKGAETDALKKAACHIGIGIDLWKKEPRNGNVSSFPQGNNTNNSAPSSGGNGFTPSQGGGAPAGGGNPVGGDMDNLYCEICGEPLTETRFKDGTAWSPAQLAVFGRRKHSKIACMTHYRELNQQKRAAEEALQSVPF